MIIILLRNPTSYFKAYRNHFVAIYAAFFAFPARELAVVFLPDETVLRAFSQLMVAAAITIAILWGHLATKLYVYPDKYSFRTLTSKPRRSIHLVFILYLLPMIATLTGSLTINDAIIVDPTTTATYLASATSYRAVAYSLQFLTVASTVIVAFIVYPFTVLVRLRSQLKDQEVRHSLKVIASSFGAISALLLLVNALESFGVSIIGPAHAITVSLLIVVVYAFSRPSFLKAFLGVLPSLEAPSTARRSDQRIMIYKSEAEKFGSLSKYVSEGLNQNWRAIYFYNGEENAVREGLARFGVNTRQHLMKGNLRLIPLSNLYQGEGIMDEEAAIDMCRELAAEARTLGKKGIRVIVDYGEQTRRPSQKFVEHLADPHWTTPDHFVNLLMAFTKTAFQGQEPALELLKIKIPTMELSDSLDTFSRTVGLSHSEITGKKILLEYEPLSNYGRVLQSLISESASNFESTILFTRKDSPGYSIVIGQPGLKSFILTSKVSYPKVEEEDRVLLPTYDSSLLLDALSKTIEAYAGASFTIILDNISHFLFTLGLDRALALVRQALELMISNKITAVFMINAPAHDQKTISIFENMFDIELVCKLAARTPEVRKRLSMPAY